MLFSDFIKNLSSLLKSEGIHFNMDTCGMFAWEKIVNILPNLDLIYFDLKHMDAAVHKKITGCDNKIILDNFTKLNKYFPNLQARMPIIPGLNDSPENITATARFLKQNNRNSIHCLRYHNLGEAKLTRMLTSLKPLNLKVQTADKLQSIKDLFMREGIDVTLYN